MRKFLRKSKLQIFTICLCLPFLQASAWWAHGHALVAQIAKQQLDSATLLKIQELLQVPIEHPGTKTLSQHEGSLPFAAVWMDSIKSYHDSDWEKCHYVDTPLTDEDFSRYTPDMSSLNYIPKIREFIKNDKKNAILCLNSAVNILKNTSQTKLNRAIALRQILHIVGDMGQPLHAAEYVDGDFHDRGGNRFVFKPSLIWDTIEGQETHVKNMHAYWDGELNSFTQIAYSWARDRKGLYGTDDRNAVENDADTILEDQTLVEKVIKKWQNEPADPVYWAADSYRIAMWDVYRFRNPVNQWDRVVTMLPSFAAYSENHNQLVKEQLLISGLRLSHLLKQTLK